MKKIFRIVLVFLLAVLFTVPAYAADVPTQETYSADSVMKPAYTAIGVLSAGLTLSASGLAECSGSVIPSGTTYTAYLTVSLQKQTGSTWQQLTYWTGSCVGFVGVNIGGNYYVDHGTYRVCSAAFVYSAQGALLDSALYYSQTRTY